MPLAGRPRIEALAAVERAEADDKIIAVLIGDPQVVIDTSTANPASTEALGAELAAVGGHFVDAPLGGTPVQAEAGQLSAMVGCDEAVFDRIRPVLDAWAAKSTRIGHVGSGHKMKLLMNFIGLFLRGAT